MPNRRRRDKGKGGRGASGARLQRQTCAQSAGAILAREALLPGLSEQLALTRSWREWLEARLPAPLPTRLAGVVERDGCLTLLAASPAWAARLRFAVQELEGQIRAHAPDVTDIRVRVMPQG